MSEKSDFVNWYWAKIMDFEKRGFILIRDKRTQRQVSGKPPVRKRPTENLTTRLIELLQDGCTVKEASERAGSSRQLAKYAQALMYGKEWAVKRHGGRGLRVESGGKIEPRMIGLKIAA